MTIHIKNLFHEAVQKVNDNFKTNTLNFIFIFIFINLFQMLFGAENTIVAIAIIIIMQSSMLLDFTSKPVFNFFIQLFILETIVVSAFLINYLNPFVAIPLNFVVLLVLLYSFTFEYTSDLYMPYVLSYLFLIFISPVSAEQLPKRMLGALVGTACVILYHMVKGRDRAGKTVIAALTEMIDEADVCIQCLLTGTGMPDSMETVRNNLYKLSHLVYEHKKKFLYISDASLATLECGLKIEKFIDMLYAFEGLLSPTDTIALENAGKWMQSFRKAVEYGESIALPDKQYYSLAEHGFGENLYNSIVGMQNRLVHMKDHDSRETFRPGLSSFKTKIKAIFYASPVKIVYTFRVSLLLSLLTALVFYWQLPHGKWLLFTVASVSLPYADDVGAKAKKRFIATLLGGAIAVTFFACIPSTLGRTIVMMFFGYLTAYFSDYKFSFACSTIGGLGGAMMVGSFGFQATSSIFAIRLFYICIGIAIAYVANNFILPFKRKAAIGNLCKRHFAIAELLEEFPKNQITDLQLYYNLVIHALLQEEKLRDHIDSSVLSRLKDYIKNKKTNTMTPT